MKKTTEPKGEQLMADEKTTIGKFVRIKKGEVCYRDADGNFTGRKVDLYAEIPVEEVNPKTGLTRGEEKACETAVRNAFAPMFRKTDAFKKYIEDCKAAGIDI